MEVGEREVALGDKRRAKDAKGEEGEGVVRREEVEGGKVGWGERRGGEVERGDGGRMNYERAKRQRVSPPAEVVRNLKEVQRWRIDRWRSQTPTAILHHCNYIQLKSKLYMIYHS